MYGKFFASTFSGSMVGAGPDVFAVWAYIIAHTYNGHVELQPVLVAATLGCDVQRVKDALLVLESPDPYSRTKVQEGRRIVRTGEFSYFVVNHQHYRSIQNEDERKAYNRVKKQESRARLRESNESNQKSMTVIEKSAVSAQTENRAQRAETESSLRSHSEPASRDSQRESPTSPVSKERGRKIKREESSAKPADKPKSRASRFAAGALGDIPVKPKDHVVPRVQAGNGHGFRHTPAREAASASQSPEAPEPGSAASESPCEEPDPATEPQSTDLPDLPVEKPAEARRAGLDVLVAGVQADNRARLTQDQKKQRAKARGIANLASDGSAPPEGSKLSKAQYMQLMGRLEGIWLKEVRAKFPSVTFTSWAGKERSQTNELVEKYGEEITGLSFLYVVRNWEALSTRMFKGKGGVPSIGMILKLHDSLVVEAQQWTKIRQVQEEVSRWKASNPAQQQGYFGATLPQELVERRRAVEPLAKTLGIVL